MPRIYEFKDISGQRFGRLLAVEITDEHCGSNLKWRCSCDCGNIVLVSGYSLRKGISQSCGCLRNDITSERMRLREGNSNLNARYKAYKKVAQKNNREFSLSQEEFGKIAGSDCFYCGTPPSNIANIKGSYKPYIYNGIDRIDSSRGYTLDNIVPCCWMCNRSKKDFSISVFLSWIEKVYNHSFKKE